MARLKQCTVVFLLWLCSAVAGGLYCGKALAEGKGAEQPQSGRAGHSPTQFDELFKIVKEEKAKDFDERYKLRKAEIEKKWDELLHSTRKEWVDYNATYDARSYVNFEEGYVETVAVIPAEKAADPTAIRAAEELIREQLKKIFSDQNDARQHVLDQQVPLKPLPTSTSSTTSSVRPTAAPQQPSAPPPVQTVAPQDVDTFFNARKQDIVVEKKPYVAGDKTPRVKVTLRFDLLPNHIQIRAKKYSDIVWKYSDKYTLPPQLVLAVIHTESYFNPLAVSDHGAYGLMQLIPSAGALDAYQYVYGEKKIVSRDYLFDPENNIELGTAYFSLLQKTFAKSIADTERLRWICICAYNWGPGNVRRHIIAALPESNLCKDSITAVLRRHNNKETVDYLQRVTEREKMYATVFQ